uniref:Uncharacterized protein n=1 Tax=Cacopsylla melanoneura TaxID=428564 RepID=A0A8D9EG60_9HEMI
MMCSLPTYCWEGKTRTPSQTGPGPALPSPCVTYSPVGALAPLQAPQQGPGVVLVEPLFSHLHIVVCTGALARAMRSRRVVPRRAGRRCIRPTLASRVVSPRVTR